MSRGRIVVRERTGAAIAGIIALGLMVMVFVNTIPASATAAGPRTAGAAALEPHAGSAALLPAVASAALRPAPAMAPAIDPAIAPSPMMRRASFTWTGNGNTDAWSNNQNWTGATGHPDDGNDDAVMPITFFVIIDADYPIDDLTITDAGHSTFTGDGTAYTLTCDTVVLSGDNNDPDSGSGIVVQSLGGVETN